MDTKQMKDKTLEVNWPEIRKTLALRIGNTIMTDREPPKISAAFPPTICSNCLEDILYLVGACVNEIRLLLFILWWLRVLSFRECFLRYLRAIIKVEEKVETWNKIYSI